MTTKYSPPISPTEIAFSDSPSVDAFSRLRVSNPLSQLDWTNGYSPATFANQQVWDTDATNGSVTARTDESSIRLSTGGTADENHATVQSKRASIYQPGKSRLLFTTFVMGAAVSNGVAEVGYGDVNNGIFIQRSSSTVNIVLRTSTSGTAVDTDVAQSSWNLDTLDGNGSSGVTLDLTKTQIFAVDLQYLGVGRIRVGFDIDGAIVYTHQFLKANSIAVAYMSTGSLPVRYIVKNSGSAGGTLTMDVICASVVSEGGYEILGYPQFGKSNAITAITTGTTLVPLVSIRPKTSFNSVTFRGHIVPQTYGLTVASNIHEYQLVKNASLGGGGTSWADVNATFSAAQSDVGSTTISGGIVIDSGYVAAGGNIKGTELNSVFSRLPIVYTSLNDTQETITLAARTVTGAGTAFGNLTWQEIY